MGGAISNSREEIMVTRQSAKSFLMSQPVTVAVIALYALLVCWACGNPVISIPEFKKEDLSPARAGNTRAGDSFYRLVPYDSINVKFTYHPEEDTKAPLIVRPDGNVTLEGIGVLKAAGFTPEELAQVIVEKSASRLKEPQVVITIAQYTPRKVYVGGEVKSPGIVLVQDGRSVTPMQAIFERGGFTYTAQMDSVVLIRDGASDTPKIGRLNLNEAMENGVAESVSLLDNDVIYVPMSGIGRADLWVRQNIRELIPWEILRPPSARDIFLR
jgi:protein involved in polysaccharide export with SLBB domain